MLTESSTSTETARQGVLAGLRVLDIGTMIAAPFACTLMADHGAEVIKVELPKGGDPMRAWTPMQGDVSLWWKVSARNKRLITLNLRSTEGRELLKQLVRSTDILVENFRPGTLEKWGLGFEVLSAIRPELVMVRISGFGQTGPYAERPGYGTVAEAMSGIPSFTGFPEGPPMLSAYPLADYMAGTFGAYGALCAIHSRSVTGKGQVVDVSLFEPLFRLLEPMVIGYDLLSLVKKRVGNRLEEDAPRNAYATRDGQFVAISASSPKTWVRFATAIGRPELADDPRFATNADRCANVDELDALVADWHCQRTLAEILAIFSEHDVVAGPLYDIERIFADEQYGAREAIVGLVDAELGPIKMQNVVPKFSANPGAVRYGGGVLGADNESVYLDELGLTRAEYERLIRQGVV